MNRPAIIIAIIVAALIAGSLGISEYRERQAQDKQDKITERVFCAQQQMISYEECMN